METKIEATVEGLEFPQIREITPMMENQMEKMMENEMDAGIK